MLQNTTRWNLKNASFNYKTWCSIYNLLCEETILMFFLEILKRMLQNFSKQHEDFYSNKLFSNGYSDIEWSKDCIARHRRPSTPCNRLFVYWYGDHIVVSRLVKQPEVTEAIKYLQMWWDMFTVALECSSWHNISHIRNTPLFN